MPCNLKTTLPNIRSRAKPLLGVWIRERGLKIKRREEGKKTKTALLGKVPSGLVQKAAYSLCKWYCPALFDMVTTQTGTTSTVTWL